MIADAIAAVALLALGGTEPPPGTTLPPTQGPSSFAAGQPATPGAPPPPAVIGGKLAKDLTEDERLQFLQQKIRTVHQADGQVEIIHVAPGYPVTLRFADSILDTIVGDPELFSVQRRGRLLEIAARALAGDCQIKVVFGGGALRVYHAFVAENFVPADSVVTVEGDLAPGAARAGKAGEIDARDLAWLIRVTCNYDAMLAEGALDRRRVTRAEIMRESRSTGFTVFHLLRIDGAAVWTFAYRNLSHQRVLFDESRLRISIGNSLFLPDYVSIHDPTLDPGGVTTGFAIVYSPVFRPEQPVEVVWR